MSKNQLSLLKNKLPYLTDGGLETTMIFKEGIDLPHFAAFTLLEKPKYRQILLDYYERYLGLSVTHQLGFILESPTWRANPDWVYKLGYDEQDLLRLNKASITLLKGLSQKYHQEIPDILISACIGPRRDGYFLEELMSVEESKDYHAQQIQLLKDAGADLISAFTLNYIEEGIGIALAAKEKEVPLVLSFTVETDGLLPSGDTLTQAIQTIDQLTESYPAYYMINCAHPSHFLTTLESGKDALKRILGIRANASCKSHAELDEALELDAGDPKKLADWYAKMYSLMPHLQVFGGCCGTDEVHLSAIAKKIVVTA